ncbi:H-NS histone family protein [Paraburkholderia tropica]|uniref:H-NS histone family protein n=1 Tax=Paraburkholderia tropica TaxID=92647 RepID=UPI0038B7F592
MSDLKTLRAELGHVNDLLADARSREVATVLARFREEIELLGITEQEIRWALGYDRPAPAPAKYYDSATGRKWSGRGAASSVARGQAPRGLRHRRTPSPSLLARRRVKQSEAR